MYLNTNGSFSPGVIYKMYDVAIMGCGPSGLTLGCLLMQRGFSVVLFDNQAFPRHQIGESLLPQSLKVWGEIGFTAALETAGFVRKNGAILYSERSKNRFVVNFSTAIDKNFDHAFQVERGRFDHFFLEFAKAQGVEIRTAYHWNGKLDVNTDHVVIDPTIKAKLFVRACGRNNINTFPEHFFTAPEEDELTALYNYFPTANMGGLMGDILVDIFYLKDSSETPCWAWGIPIADDILSVGHVVPSRFVAEQRKKHSLEGIFENLLSKTANLKGRITPQPRDELRVRHKYQRLPKRVWADKQIFIGDAAGFIDPVFSSGVHLGVSSARFLADILVANRDNLGQLPTAAYEKYQSHFMKTFVSYYYLVKMFYNRNIVENLFLKVSDSDRTEEETTVIREFTSILAGDVESPNGWLKKMSKLRSLGIRDDIKEHFDQFLHH